jgi:L-rhamnose isomerase
VYVRFPSTSVGQGWVRFVRFQEVGRAQQMTEKGAVVSLLALRNLLAALKAGGG